jgi:hypothetical protein
MGHGDSYQLPVISIFVSEVIEVIMDSEIFLTGRDD